MLHCPYGKPRLVRRTKWNHPLGVCGETDGGDAPACLGSDAGDWEEAGGGTQAHPHSFGLSRDYQSECEFASRGSAILATDTVQKSSILRCDITVERRDHAC